MVSTKIAQLEIIKFISCTSISPELCKTCEFNFSDKVTRLRTDVSSVGIQNPVKHNVEGARHFIIQACSS